MKRTKERMDFGHPSNREGISGLTYFDGEDNYKPERTKQQINETKFWIDLQKEEKKTLDDMEANKERYTFLFQNFCVYLLRQHVLSLSSFIKSQYTGLNMFSNMHDKHEYTPFL